MNTVFDVGTTILVPMRVIGLNSRTNKHEGEICYSLVCDDQVVEKEIFKSVVSIYEDSLVKNLQDLDIASFGRWLDAKIEEVEKLGKGNESRR